MNQTTLSNNMKEGVGMPKEWSAFRITLVLYFIIFLLPISFYAVSSTFKQMQTDTKVLRISSKLPGAMLVAGSNLPVSHIDRMFKEVLPWVQQHEKSEYYIGGTTLMQDFANAKSCWEKVKTGGTAAKYCYEPADHFANIVEKMIYLKQKKVINLFYISLSIAMILILLTVYFVRIFIHQQMKKHAIHDHETGLFNKKYCLAELKSTCARSARYNHPLSLLSISLDQLFDDIYSDNERKQVLKQLGGLLTATTRESDVACRYSKKHILIILPDTEEAKSKYLIKRMKEVLKEHNFMVEPKPDFFFSVIQYDHTESAEACVKRAETFMKENGKDD